MHSASQPKTLPLFWDICLSSPLHLLRLHGPHSSLTSVRLNCIGSSQSDLVTQSWHRPAPNHPSYSEDNGHNPSCAPMPSRLSAVSSWVAYCSLSGKHILSSSHTGCLASEHKCQGLYTAWVSACSNSL